MTDKEHVEMLADERFTSQAVTDGGPGVVSTDDIIKELFRHRTWKYNLFLLSLGLTALATPPAIFITSIAGISPNIDNTWTCRSEKCKELILVNSSLLEEFPCTITREVHGKTILLLKSSDIEWDMTHSSFAVEFDLYCEIGGRKELKTLQSSIYFAGALTGLLLGGFLFDQIGRKKTSLLAYFTVVISTLTGTFCHSYYFLLAIRFLQGAGGRMLITGMYILFIELVPTKYGNYANFWVQCLWALGYPIAAGIGYFVTNWNYMFLATSIVVFVFNIQVFFCIESPRYHLMKNDEKSAKTSIKALAALTGTKLDIENMVFEDLGKANQRKQSFWQQLVDLCSYPILLCETLLQMFLWFVVGMSYYGFNFGWGSIVPNRYLGYVMGSIGHLVGSLILFPLIIRIGRRRAMILMFVGATTFFLLAILDKKLGKDTNWTLESVCSLIGVIFISGCLSGIYLWTAELAPTSHRGFVSCLTSSVARVGSFLGPYLINNLKPITHKVVPLSGLALLTLFCALSSFFLVETGDKKTALTGEAVATRRKSHIYRTLNN